MPRRVIDVLVTRAVPFACTASWPLWLSLAQVLIGRGSDSLRLVRPEKENTSKRPLLMQQHFEDSIAHQARSIAASSCIVSVVSLLALSRHPTARQRTLPSVILDCLRETSRHGASHQRLLYTCTANTPTICSLQVASLQSQVCLRLLSSIASIIWASRCRDHVGCRRRRASQAWSRCGLLATSFASNFIHNATSTNHDNHLGASSGRLPNAVANDSIAVSSAVGEIDSNCFFVRTQLRVAIAAKTQGLSIPACVGNQPPALTKDVLLIKIKDYWATVTPHNNARCQRQACSWPARPL